MLSLMRKHAYSWAIRAILFLIVVVFAFWGIGTGIFQQVRPVAILDGQKILPDEVDHEAEQLKRILQGTYGPAAAEVLKGMNLRQSALDRIIENRLVQREARRLGLEISDEELERSIAADRAFQVDGHFDVRTYEEVLRTANFLPAQYEASTREAMVADTLRQMIGEGIQLSDDEARREFDRRNERLSMAYLEVPWSQFAAGINPTEQQIAEYYKKNAEQFREPERVKASFIHYDPFILADKVVPPDKEIRDYYDRYQKTVFRHPERVHARHILISVATGAAEAEKAEARKKAEDIVHQLKGGADFAKLAAKYSDDGGNKFSGGDLGFFARGQMVKPFEDAAFKLKAGEVGMAETRFGYHVIKTEELKPAHIDTLDEARPKILENLKKKAGTEIARETLREDLAAALAGRSLKEIAAKRGLELVETVPFSERDSVKGAEGNRNFVRSAFRLDKGEVRAVTGKDVDSYLVKLTDRFPSRIPPLAEIHDRVRETLVRARAEEAARNYANGVLKQIEKGTDFNQVAAQNKLQVHLTGDFDRASRSVPAIGQFPEVTDAAGMVAKVPGLIDRVMEHDDNSYIFELLGRTAPSEEEWKKAAEGFKEELLQTRRAQAWTAFLDRLKQRAQIWVDPNQLGETATEPSM